MLDLLKFEILNIRKVRRTSVHHSVKFCDSRSNHCVDMAIFAIFLDGDRRPFLIFKS